MGLGLAVVFLLLVYLVSRALHTGPRKACVWRRLHAAPKGHLSQYKCRTCGVEAYTATEKPPVDCKKRLKPKPL